MTPLLLCLAICPTTIQRSIPYVEHGTKEQILDLFIPETTPKALVVFVYGGGWHSPRSESVDEVANSLNADGFACALISHRLGPASKFPAQIEDVASATAYLELRQDLPHKIILMGHSSGAHLVMLLVTDPRYLAKVHLRSSDFTAVVGLSTPLDLQPKSGHIGFGDSLLAGHGADTFARDLDLMKEASPIEHSGAKLPPTLLVAGDNDFPGLTDDMKAFQIKNPACRIRLEPNCTHMGTIAKAIDRKSSLHKSILVFITESLKAPRPTRPTR